MPAVEPTRAFLSLLVDGGTLILRDDSRHELITGSAAQLHRVNQAPRRFTTRETFDAFTNPDHEKLFMSRDPADVEWMEARLTDQPWKAMTQPVRLCADVSMRVPHTFSGVRRFWKSALFDCGDPTPQAWVIVLDGAAVRFK